jgi:beta-lactamase class A
MTQLEAKLARAYGVIRQLRQQNAELEEQIARLQSQDKQELTSPVARSSLSSLQKVNEVNQQGSARFRRHRVKKNSFLLSKLQFTVIATAVATIFTITGLGLIRSLPQHPVENPTKPLPLASPLPRQASGELVYNASKSPNFRQSQELQAIVDELVKLAHERGLSTANLSITLIDVNRRESAGYQEHQLRYPASVVKLFWMAALYAQIEGGILPDERAFAEDLEKMLVKSDNEAASRILDAITNTESGSELTAKELSKWIDKRKQIDRFFQAAGYQGINLSQKTFPIPYLKLNEPKGRDRQMRGDSNKPVRNKMTTQQAARLMYEIVTRQAVSPQSSEKMERWLTRDLRPEAWENIDVNVEFNPIQAFFGESLPTNLQFLSKAGWTSSTRQEVAFVRTRDGKTAYILAVFAEDRAYADDWKIFPALSSHVFNRMTRQH